MALLDFSQHSPIFITLTLLQPEDTERLEAIVSAAKGLITYQVSEAKAILSKTIKVPRISFDLRALGIWTTPKAEHHASDTALGSPIVVYSVD